MDEPFLSIILPTYNRLYSLKEIFLPSLEKQNFLDYELVVVDDESTDWTDRYFRSTEFEKKFKNISERFVYEKNKKNIWAPGSRNRGVILAKGVWTWIVEDDIQVDDVEFLQKAFNLLNELDESISVLSPQRKESLAKGYYKNPPNTLVQIWKISGEIYLDPDQEYSGLVDNTHCSSFIKKVVYLKLWGQDEKTFFWNTFRDESDLYFRIVKAWYWIYYVWDILKIIHRNDFAKKWWQKKINNRSLFVQEFTLIKNHFLYLKKNYNFAEWRILFFVLVRWIKHISNTIWVKFIKNILVLLHI